MPLARRLLAGALLAATTALTPAHADVRAGVDAWQAGNFPRAVAEWKPLAEAGDADAQFNLGQAYKLGRGVPADLSIAQRWYERAAKQNHEEAQANLGLIMFQNGQQEAGMVWIRRAADNGDPRARYVLGTALFNGDMVAKDWPRAYALMNRAAAQGLTAASDSLVQMENVLPESDRQQGMNLARDLARADAKREASVQSAQSEPRQAPPKTFGPPVEITRSEPSPPASAPEQRRPLQVATARQVEPLPAPEELAEPVAAPVPLNEVMPTWRIGRAPKPPKVPKPRPVRTEESAAPVPEPVATPRVEVAAAPPAADVSTQTAPAVVEAAPAPAPVVPQVQEAAPATSAPVEVAAAAQAPGATPPAVAPVEVASTEATSKAVEPDKRSNRRKGATKTPETSAEAPAAPTEPATHMSETVPPSAPQPVEAAPVDVASVSPPAAEPAPTWHTGRARKPPKPPRAKPEPAPASSDSAASAPQVTASTPESAPTQLAAAEPTGPVTVEPPAAASASLVAAPAPESATVQVAASETATPPPVPVEPASGSQPAEQQAAPPAQEPTPQPQAVPDSNTTQDQSGPVQLAQADPTETPGDPALAAPEATAKPKSKTAPSKPAPLITPGGKWRVQLGAYGTMDLAKGRWANLSRKAQLFTGLQPSYEQAGDLTRLRVNSLADRSAAEKVCSAAKSAGQACFAIAP